MLVRALTRTVPGGSVARALDGKGPDPWISTSASSS
jgi:hypothetical protein